MSGGWSLSLSRSTTELTVLSSPGPLYITQLYAEFGPRVTFAVAAGIAVLRCVLCVKSTFTLFLLSHPSSLHQFLMVLVAWAYYKRLVPHAYYSLQAASGGDRSVKTKSVLLH